jgi:hypothetical protein
MGRLGLTLNGEKTSLQDVCTEHFDFLEYTFSPHCGRHNGWL